MFRYRILETLDAVQTGLVAHPRAPPERLPSEFGPALRMRRAQRALSQLALSLRCGVSQRHISFVESGRASPSRQVVLQLAEGLDLLAHQRDELLLRAGYAPLSRLRFGSAEEAASDAAARDALQRVLERHEPFPAVVLNGLGYVQMTNPSARRFASRLVSAPIENLTLSVLDPHGLRPRIANWQEVARQHLLRVRRELALYQDSRQYEAFVADLKRLTSGMPDMTMKPSQLPDATLIIKIRAGDQTIELLSMIVQFSAAYDAGLQELRVECFFPANDASREAFHRLNVESSTQRQAP